MQLDVCLILDIMALEKRHSISTFLAKFVWIIFLVFQNPNLVICDEFEDDSLKSALLAVERRQRDLELQDNDFYGQPENIGYGFHKTLGFFDNSGPAMELGSFDSGLKNENELQNALFNYGGYQKGTDYDDDYEKLKSSFRERTSDFRNKYIINERENGEEDPQEYLELLRSLWSKYRQSRPDDVSIEDLTDEQVEELLEELYDKRNEERFGNEYKGFEPDAYVIPIRSRKNYRIFDRFGEANKIIEGAKRNLHSQNLNYDLPSENEFLYSLKYVTPEFNREAVENLRDEGFEMLGDEKDRDVMRLLNNAATNRPKYQNNDELYWLRDQNGYDEDGLWLQAPVSLSNDLYEDLGRNEKRTEPKTRFFKNHNGVHINVKRFPVKRSSIRVRKEAKDDKVQKEIKNIFNAESTTVPPKKTTTKKPTDIMKKQNVTKPEVTKHHEVKKVVRRAEKYLKEEVPVNYNKEVAEIFNVRKKSIDWSQYFGLDKRSSWLKHDNLRRAEEHFMSPKMKRLSMSRSNTGNVNFLDRSQYEMPFDARKLSKKGYSYDIGNNIDRVENKIGDIEDKIIDDAVKYTGAHSGTGGQELSKVKNKVIQNLEAAYSLEKMKSALEEFKNLIKPEKNGEEALRKTSTETPKVESRTLVSKEAPNLEKPFSEKPSSETSKRVAIKKEGVKKSFDESEDALEFLNDRYENRQFEEEGCPVLDKILHNCLRIEEMGGRFAETLAPLCTLQQICYFCGPEIGFSKMSMCDAMYLSEAQNICQGDSTCLVSARNGMLALQDLYEQDLLKDDTRRLLSGSCLSNTCIQKYFLTSPGAIYPLEVQK